jgi:SAM-dependent methyltransferase
MRFRCVKGSRGVVPGIACLGAAVFMLTNACGHEPRAAAERPPDVEYVPSAPKVVDRMLEIAEVGEQDVVYDLGCGDGRIVVEAARRFGARGVGIDIDPTRVKEARENARRHGVERLVRIEQNDLFAVDLSPATVVTLYLLPELNVRLIPQLEKLPSGARIVSHEHAIEGIPHDASWSVSTEEEPRPGSHWLCRGSGPCVDCTVARDCPPIEHSIYLWRAPIRPSRSRR